MDNFDILFPDNRSDGTTNLKKAQLVMLRMLKIFDFICRKHNIQYWLCEGTLLGAVRHKGFIPWDDDLDIAMLREDFERFVKVAKTDLPPDLFLQTRENEPAYNYLPLVCKIRDTKSILISPYLDKQTYHKGLFLDIFPFDRFHRYGYKGKKESCLKKINRLLNRCYDADIDKENSVLKSIVARFKPIFRWLIIKYQARIQPIIVANKKLPDNDCYVGHGFDIPWHQKMEIKNIFPLQEILFEGEYFYAPGNTDAYLKQIYGSDYMTPPPEHKRIPSHSTTIKHLI